MQWVAKPVTVHTSLKQLNCGESPMPSFNAWSDPYKKYCRDAKATRATYLRQLAEDYDYPIHKIFLVADILGPTEDFDGLISHLDNLSVWE
jgi:hypothetical protein